MFWLLANFLVSLFWKEIHDLPKLTSIKNNTKNVIVECETILTHFFASLTNPHKCLRKSAARWHGKTTMHKCIPPHLTPTFDVATVPQVGTKREKVSLNGVLLACSKGCALRRALICLSTAWPTQPSHMLAYWLGKPSGKLPWNQRLPPMSPLQCLMLIIALEPTLSEKERDRSWFKGEKNLSYRKKKKSLQNISLSPSH